MMSWDIARQKDNSCMTAVLFPPMGVSWEWALSLCAMEKPATWLPMRLSGFPFDAARNRAAYECLNRGIQWLFFLDADVVAPRETITRLMSHKLPIVSGLYFQKYPTWTGDAAEYLPVICNESIGPDKKITKQPITHYTPGSLIECDYVPAGCLLVHTSVFERMLNSGIKEFFKWTLTAASEPPGSGRSEDFEFSANARSLGYKCICDTSIICAHETTTQVTIKGLSPKL
ncbi:MAG: hypothetical protein PHQ43_01285 [Dehalococcoidales bacterium]|nr:hypothetical protein [Dehalococcoidales bacterium]